MKKRNDFIIWFAKTIDSAVGSAFTVDVRQFLGRDHDLYGYRLYTIAFRARDQLFYEDIAALAAHIYGLIVAEALCVKAQTVYGVTLFRYCKKARRKSPTDRWLFARERH